jgi:hypothetical protein
LATPESEEESKSDPPRTSPKFHGSPVVIGDAYFKKGSDIIKMS